MPLRLCLVTTNSNGTNQGIVYLKLLAIKFRKAGKIIFGGIAKRSDTHYLNLSFENFEAKVVGERRVHPTE